MSPITQDKYDGRKEVFDIVEIYLNSGKPLTKDDFEREKAHWLSNPIQNKSQIEIDQSTLKSASALAAIHRKELETIVNLQQQVIHGHEALKKVKFD